MRSSAPRSRDPIRSRRLLRRVLALLAVLAALLFAVLRPVGPAEALVPESGVRVLTVDGVISPVSARYLARELEAAEGERAAAVVVRLDTPGGLERSMREMTTEILGSPVPVIVWVAPSGARAASAGMFDTIAAHVAAMAPGTDIGAAHPVQLGGGDDTTTDKVVADAAAYARSLAELRGRNAEWAEQAVVESIAASAEEAVERDVVDVIAADLDALLAHVDGLTVRTTDGAVPIRTAGVAVVERDMPLLDRILQAVTDPNIAYILFLVGVIGILSELYNPGAIFPGATGVLALVLAFVGMGSLPVSAVGIVLILLGVGLFVGDLLNEGLGVLAIPGLLAFVFGSFVLYRPLSPASPALPTVRIEPWLIAAMAGVLVAFFALVVRALVRSRQEPVAAGTEALVGRTGVAVSPLAPRGTVRVDSEVWTAIAENGSVPEGATVEVVGLSGVTLHVRSLH